MPALLPPGRELGAYTLRETLAERAFSVTYRAEQRALGRTVLVKALKSTISVGSPFAGELEREAAILARLDHEAIPRLYDFSRTAESVWMVLEDARGVSLAAILAAARLEPGVAAAIALSVARGLGHAHERGVVHRALRPSAVEVAPGGRVRIIDFSSAETGDARLPPAPEPVETVGSSARADLLAPEQILGDSAGPRTDVWSLGALLHEMLTGEGPFAAGEPREIAARIRGAAPAPLPDSIPRALDRVVARCLSKAPEDRYAEAGAAAVAIEEALAGISRLPVRVLCSRALAAAKLGEALAPPGDAALHERRSDRRGPDVARAARSLAAVLALMTLGGAAIQVLKDDGVEAAGGVTEEAQVASRDRGQVRVVARPWAEVYVDGELFDTTPIGRPIPVTPGRHFITFRHPAAPDEQRSIKIAGGQTVLLDVTMMVARADAGTKTEARPDAGASP